MFRLELRSDRCGSAWPLPLSQGPCLKGPLIDDKPHEVLILILVGGAVSAIVLLCGIAYLVIEPVATSIRTEVVSYAGMQK